MTSPVLIAYDGAQALLPTLCSRFSGVEFLHVETPEELLPTLERVRPAIVFSIKGPGFPAECHRPIMEFPSVQWVQVGGSGYEHLAPWDRTRLKVTNCAGVLARYLAETATGAMLCLNGNFPAYYRQQMERTWLPRSFRPLSDQTILIVGLGHIGRSVADNAKALGMRVLAIRRQQIKHPSVDVLGTPEDLPGLIGEADVVSLHLRLTNETRHLFNAEMFATMKHNSLFLNTSRGSVVHEESLIAALQAGQIRGAYLDVFEEEPLPMQSPLWSMPNVLITPHAADDVDDWQLKFAQFFGDNLQRWIDGDALQNLV